MYHLLYSSTDSKRLAIDMGFVLSCFKGGDQDDQQERQRQRRRRQRTANQSEEEGYELEEGKSSFLLINLTFFYHANPDLAQGAPMPSPYTMSANVTLLA